MPLTGVASVVAFSVIIAYIVICLSLGWLGKKSTKDLKDFTIAGMKIGGLLIGLSWFATSCSASSYIGWSGLGWSYGTVTFWAQGIGSFWGWALGFFLVGTRAAKFTKKLGSLTYIDLLCDRYQSQVALRAYLSILFVIGMTVMLVAQLKGAGLVFEAITGFPYWAGCAIAFIIVAIYMTIGGKFADIYTDTLQGFMMLAIAVVGVGYGLAVLGGWEGFRAHLMAADPKLWNLYMPPKFPPEVLYVWPLFFMVSSAAAIYAVPNIMTAKSAREAKKGIIYAWIAFLIATPLTGLFGCIARAMGVTPRTPDLAFIEFIIRSFPPVIVGAFLAAIFAAVMSTVDGIALAAGTCGGNDFYRKFWVPVIKKGDPNDPVVQRNATRIIQIIMWASLALAFYWAAIAPPLYLSWLLFTAFGMMAAALFAPFVLGLYFKFPTKMGAIASSVCGLGFYLGWFAYSKLTGAPFHFAYVLPITACIAAIILVIVSKFTKPLPKEFLDELFA